MGICGRGIEVGCLRVMLSGDGGGVDGWRMVSRWMGGDAVGDGGVRWVCAWGVVGRVGGEWGVCIEGGEVEAECESGSGRRVSGGGGGEGWVWGTSLRVVAGGRVEGVGRVELAGGGRRAGRKGWGVEGMEGVGVVDVGGVGRGMVRVEAVGGGGGQRGWAEVEEGLGAVGDGGFWEREVWETMRVGFRWMRAEVRKCWIIVEGEAGGEERGLGGCLARSGKWVRMVWSEVETWSRSAAYMTWEGCVVLVGVLIQESGGIGGRAVLGVGRNSLRDGGGGRGTREVVSGQGWVGYWLAIVSYGEWEGVAGERRDGVEGGVMGAWSGSGGW
ncbi:hypothetical protein Tco_1163854 [Tanacetum coccineum]